VHVRLLEDEGRDAPGIAIFPASGINVDRRCPRVSTLQRCSSKTDSKRNMAFAVAVNRSSNWETKLIIADSCISIRSWVLESSERSTHPELFHAGHAGSELDQPAEGPPVEAISLVHVLGEPPGSVVSVHSVRWSHLSVYQAAHLSPGSVVSVDSGWWRLSHLSVSKAARPSVSQAAASLTASAHGPHDSDWSVGVRRPAVAQRSYLHHVLEGILDVRNANDADKKGNGKLEPQ
jgi:hypothetical protein